MGKTNRSLHRLGILLALLLIGLPRIAGAEMPRYESKYYVIYSDLDPKYVKEAALRMTRMAEEYHARTAGFSGVIKHKFPFYLYENADDYFANGGMKGSCGVFIGGGDDGGRLMAIAGKHPTDDTWHTIQHEGFHQFAHAVIQGDIPTWLNEGLAEYFGESIFTGDGFVTGVVPPYRLQRVKEEMEAKKFKSVSAMMKVSAMGWAAEMSYINYDQAWSMTYFLVHGDGGKYQPALCRCLTETAGGSTFTAAWNHQIGSADGFESRWSEYWKAQPKSPTPLLYARATCATLTSFLARATAQKQTFEDFHAFFDAASNGKLKIVDDDWLPSSLLESAVRRVESEEDWSLITVGKNKAPAIVLKLEDGTLLTGTFVLDNNNRVQNVFVEIDDLQLLLNRAATETSKEQRAELKKAVVASMRDHPRSPATVEARKFLHSTP